ncbi:hypothetical protein SDC9_157189 [bioreactor metagenome]|uniref:Uncharacterized protein n=1 Tax=bioreactor metagenome TaxID=1076179 RepID=A0A645F8E7_9ZZZZ
MAQRQIAAAAFIIEQFFMMPIYSGVDDVGELSVRYEVFLEPDSLKIHNDTGSYRFHLFTYKVEASAGNGIDKM